MEHLTLPTGQQVKLGRKPPLPDKDVPHLRDYVTLDAVQPPPEVDYTPKAMPSLSRMYLNDRYGDCVIAGKYHGVGVWTGNEAGMPAVGSDSEVYNAYESICGPGDNGCVITQVLDHFVKVGLPFGGQVHKIDGYARVDWTNRTLVEVAIHLFGVVTLGINLPEAWRDASDLWAPTDTPIVGGHDVEAVGYNAQGVVVATWGSLRLIRWDALVSHRWVEEAYVLLSPDWYADHNLAPPGVDMMSLQVDLLAFSQGQIPPLGPRPGPPVPPVPTPEPPPVPPPTPPSPPAPAPAGLTLQQAINAVVAGIERGRPYPVANAIVHAEINAVNALRAAWPRGAAETDEPETPNPET